MADLYKDIKKTFDSMEEKIYIECVDSENQLKQLITYLALNGNGGHSFTITVDPGDEREKKFYWDGDGSDRIIEMNGEKIDKWFKKYFNKK